jgi:hypothetical protein
MLQHENIMFQLFQPYVAASGFHIASILFGCFMCFTHMLQVHVPNISSVFRRTLHSNVFHVASVLCCSAGDEPGVGGRGAVGWGALRESESHLHGESEREEVQGKDRRA